VLTLMVSQKTPNSDRYNTEVSLYDSGVKQTSTELRFSIQFSPRDREDIRWYLEDFLRYCDAPAPEIAARVEQRMQEIGGELFHAIFDASDETRTLWADVRTHLGEIRVEINSSHPDWRLLPWELMRDPETNQPISLGCRAFVRVSPCSEPARGSYIAKGECTRVLFVICRPFAEVDVAFRSVAGPVLQSLASFTDHDRLPAFAAANIQGPGRNVAYSCDGGSSLSYCTF